MQSIFITKIDIKKVRHLENVKIALSENARKHLILTGKNGSGKTSVLESLKKLTQVYWRTFKDEHISISLSKNTGNSPEIMFAYISSVRNKLIVPKSIELFELEDKSGINQNASKDFLRYILSLDYQLYGAKTDNNSKLEANLKKWFGNFETSLKEIYDCNELKLKRDTKNLTFKIDLPGREPFGLHEMADGYAAFLDIYMELLMRFEDADAVVNYEQSAIVMIDELETHLHVELQKRALPFLTRLFPNVQFIIATHSPFVMTSLENAVVYDLEKHEYLEKPSFYSYETVVESFLDTSMYSNELKNYFARYKELCLKERTPKENDEFLRAKAELEIRSIPSTELYIAFHNLEKQRKAAKNG
ncbi:MAG: AAA family ATPase [Lachnospiraceae bacterium]|nr:AAA family ATPase [Lachnospiraceae bacterium]